MPGITEYLEILLGQADLTFEQAKSLLDTVFQGRVSEHQIAAFLTAMRVKGAKADELAGLARSLRDHAVSIETGIDNLIDTCGSGGARLKTFNISTASAIVAAGAGAQAASGPASTRQIRNKAGNHLKWLCAGWVFHGKKTIICSHNQRK